MASSGLVALHPRYSRLHDRSAVGRLTHLLAGMQGDAALRETAWETAQAQECVRLLRVLWQRSRGTRRRPRRWPGLAAVALTDVFARTDKNSSDLLIASIETALRNSRCDTERIARLWDLPGAWYVLEGLETGRSRVVESAELLLLCMRLGALGNSRALNASERLEVTRVIEDVDLWLHSLRSVTDARHGGTDTRTALEVGVSEAGGNPIRASEASEESSKSSSSSSSSSKSSSSKSSSSKSSSSRSSSSSSKSRSSRSSKSKKQQSSGSMPLGSPGAWHFHAAIGGGSGVYPAWTPVVVPVSNVAAPRNILLIGMWPPSNEVISQFSLEHLDPVTGTHAAPYIGDLGWLSSDLAGVVVRAFYAKFEPGLAPGRGLGGRFQVDYDKVRADLEAVTADLRPAAIIVFTKGSTASSQGTQSGVAGEVDFLLEKQARNLLVDFAPVAVRGTAPLLLAWKDMLVAKPYVDAELSRYHSQSQTQETWSNQFYFYISDDVINVAMPGTQPVFATLRQQQTHQLQPFPGKPPWEFGDGLLVIDASNRPLETRGHTLPWGAMVNAGAGSPFTYGVNNGYAGSYVSEYTNYCALRYAKASMARPKKEQCPYAGHIHVASNLVRGSRDIGYARDTVTLMVIEVARLLIRGGYV